MDWRSLLGAVAPTVATALGGPFAGLAVEAVGKAFGMEQPTLDKIQKAITNGQMSSDQIVALKQAENALVTRMRELDIQEQQLSFADTDSARKMQTSNKSVMPGVLSVFVTLGFFGILVAIMGGKVDLSGNTAAMLMLGSLGTGWGTTMQFWFGTTHDSGKKSDVIASQLQSQP